MTSPIIIRMSLQNEKVKNTVSDQAVVAHNFNTSTKQRQMDLCEFEASLVYKADA